MDNQNIKRIINQVARSFAKSNVNYSQSQYIIREVRKKLELKPPKKSKGTVKRLSRQEYKVFIKAAYNKSSYVGLMMQTLFETAARVSEFIRLNADDIYHDELRIIIRDGKGDKRREIPIEENLDRLLSTHLKDRRSGALFLSQRSKRFTDRRIQQLVKEVAQKAGITSLEVTPHILRHSRATFLLEDGMGKDYLQDFLGHDEPSSTQVYTKTAALDMDKEFRRVVASRGE